MGDGPFFVLQEWNKKGTAVLHAAKHLVPYEVRESPMLKNKSIPYPRVTKNRLYNRELKQFNFEDDFEVVSAYASRSL